MTLAFQILRAAHASGTHHKLALDALRDLNCPRRDEWRDSFLKHIGLYVEGAKAPDKEFKDFKNHVLHPGDDFWGGAPEKARNWYQHLVVALRERNWSEAAWCAGILSHYVTDPVMPFHTAQSEAENAIHRATEWSISKSYDALIREADSRNARPAPAPSDTADWLQDYVCLAAETSHEQYERLIAHYDINTGVVTPEKGLDPIARRLVGELLIYARTAFAHILDRAIVEAAAQPPAVTLTPQAALGALKIPLRWVLNRMEDAEARSEVEAMYDELTRTGRVEDTLPEDDRVVRDLHEKEVAAPRRAARRAERTKRVKSGREKHIRDNLNGRTPLAPALSSLKTADPTPEKSSNPSAAAPSALQPAASPPAEFTPEERQDRYYLTATDNVEAGPSVGPKTAERLAGVGIITVSDLLEADPAKIADELGDRRINAQTVERWQDEAKLMLSVAGLRVTQSQLLVGAGYRYCDDIAEAAPQDLSAALLAFAATQAGQRLLRDGSPPDVEKIKCWIDSAKTHAAKAA